MGYVSDNLITDEKILFTARVHPAVFLRSAILFVMTILLLTYSLTKALDSVFLYLCGALFLYAIALGIQAAIALFATEFAITTRRVIAKRGFIRRSIVEILLPKVESVSVTQSILGRLLGFGTITVTGTGGTRGSLRAIIDPLGVKQKIQQVIEGYR